MENFKVICNKCGSENVELFTKFPEENATLKCVDCGAETYVEYDGKMVEK